MTFTEKELRTIFRNRLKRRENPEYLKWVADNFPKYLEGHHVLGSIKSNKGRGKLNDLLIAKISTQEHLYRTMQDPNHDLIGDLVQAIDSAFDYIEDLQRENKHLQQQLRNR